MDIKQAAQAAINCQNASNLSGIVFSFAQAMQAICDESNEKHLGTHWKNTHPIVTLFLQKLCELNATNLGKSGTWDSFHYDMDAYFQCSKIAKQIEEKAS